MRRKNLVILVVCIDGQIAFVYRISKQKGFQILENLISLLVVIIAFEHLYFLVLEMFLWTHPKGLKVFGQTLEQAQASAKLAKNQGLYNGFLAAGLLWSLVHPSPDFSYELRLFFLDCVILAGVYGALTANKKIFFIQALPAIVTLALVVLRG